MIVFGTRSVHLKTVPDSSTKCPECAEPGGVLLDVYQEYLHAFFIPMVASGKTVLARCSKCGTTFDKGVVASSFKSSAAKAKASSTTPVWAFVGVPILAAGIAFSVLQDRKADEAARPDPSACLAKLSVGQTYELNVGKAAYGDFEVKRLIRVDTVTQADVTYVTGMVERRLDDTSPLPPMFDSKSVTRTRDEFGHMKLLGCQ